MKTCKRKSLMDMDTDSEDIPARKKNGVWTY